MQFHHTKLCIGFNSILLQKQWFCKFFCQNDSLIGNIHKNLRFTCDIYFFFVHISSQVKYFYWQSHLLGKVEFILINKFSVVEITPQLCKKNWKKNCLFQPLFKCIFFFLVAFLRWWNFIFKIGSMTRANQKSKKHLRSKSI